MPAKRTSRVPPSSPGRTVASSTQAAELVMARRAVTALTVPLVPPNQKPKKEGWPPQAETTMALPASSASVAVVAPNKKKRGCQWASATPTDPKAVKRTTASAV